MTAAKKNTKLPEIAADAENKFFQHLQSYELYHRNRIMFAAKLHEQYTELANTQQLETSEVKFKLISYACLLDPDNKKYWPILAKEISRHHTSEVRKGMIDSVANYLEELPLNRQPEEFGTKFIKNFLDGEEIYLEIDKLDQYKKHRANFDNLKKITSGSRLAPGKKLEELAEEWGKDAITQDKRKRLKNASDLFNEVKIKQSSEEKLTDFALAKTELYMAYIDPDNEEYLNAAQEAINANFSNDEVTELVEIISYARGRVVPKTVFEKNVNKLLTTLQLKYDY